MKMKKCKIKKNYLFLDITKYFFKMYINSRLNNHSLEDLEKVPTWEATGFYHHRLYVYGTYAKQMDTLTKLALGKKNLGIMVPLKRYPRRSK